MQGFEFNTVRQIINGCGSALQLASQCRHQGMSRPLLVTDPGLMAIGLVQPVIAALEQAGFAPVVFDQVREDPPEATVLTAADLGRSQGVDGVIAVGGGSSMDVAKVVAVLLAGQQALSQLYGVGNVSGGRLPLVLVPTTAGTGSEVTPVAVITTGETTKAGVSSPVLLPDAAVLDADLTLGLPPAVTAMTGVDAMVHAIEAYASASPNNNPISNNLATQALTLMGGSLERAVHHGDDIAARSDMLLGSLLAGQAFANSPVAAVHALAYPIGGHFHVPHGLSNALVLPHVLRFNAKVAPQPYAELAPFVFPELAELQGQARAEAFCDALADLSRRCGLQQRLRDMDIPREILPRLASDAMNQTRLLVNNPREVTEADALAIYQAAW